VPHKTTIRNYIARNVNNNTR